jgi:hypothetical protein
MQSVISWIKKKNQRNAEKQKKICSLKNVWNLAFQNSNFAVSLQFIECSKVAI